jgi:hypothetical protein
VLRWKGNGEVRLVVSSASWTFQPGKSRNATQVSPDRWKTTFGSDTYVVLSFTGPAQLFPLIILATDPARTGARLRGLQFYRLDDEADLLAGKVYRAPYKRSLVDFCPSAIRFVDWVGGNNSRITRFERRARPDYAAFGGKSDWVASLPYGEAIGINQYSLERIDGMPGSPVHGEIVTCRLASGMARAGAKKVTAISNSNPGRVTAPSHGFADGDVIAHQFEPGVLPKLHFLPCTITVIDADTYSIGVDTTTFGSLKAQAFANQFITLDVGRRGAFPVVFPIPYRLASHYGSGYIAKGDYKTFIFDKTVAAQTDGNGNFVYGVWMFNDLGANNGHAGGIPLELCTALVNEVNEMTPVRPVSMWLNIPHLALCSMDPDFSDEASWGIQSVKTILNGANGFAGLTSSAELLVEYSNETWNSGGSAFSQTYYLAYRGHLRWPTCGTADYASMAALRSVVNVEDIKGSRYASPRIRFVLAGQGTLGASGMNQLRMDGTAHLLKDPLNVWGPTVPPMAHHDYFAFAGYFLPSAKFDASNLAVLTAKWVAAAGNPAMQEAVCAAYVNGIVDPAVGGSETVDRYSLELLPAYVSKLRRYGKSVIMYEGGWDRAIKPITFGNLVSASIPYAIGAIDGQSNIISGVKSGYATAVAPGDFILGYGIPPDTTVQSASGTTIILSANTTRRLAIAQFVAFAPEQMFLLAVKRSQAWAAAMLRYFSKFGSGSGMPADYVQSDLRWGHSFPSTYGFADSEWSDLDLLWGKEGERNRALN